jgi:hypothetical protein
MLAIIVCWDAPLMVMITNHQGFAGDGPGASRSSVVCAYGPQDVRASAFLDLKGAIRRRDVLGIVGPHSRQPRVGDAQLQKQVSLER